MLIKLHTQRTEMVQEEGKKPYMKRIPEVTEFDLDPTLNAQSRFEAKFPAMAEREDLLGYTTRIKNCEKLTAPVVISKMKALYCWFKTDMSFEDFISLFDLTDKEYVDRLTEEIKDIFEAIYDSASEKN